MLLVTVIPEEEEGTADEEEDGDDEVDDGNEEEDTEVYLFKCALVVDGERVDDSSGIRAI